MRRALGAICLLAWALGGHGQELIVRTVAGGGVGDFGNALDAAMSGPVALAMTAHGDLFVVDQRFQRVRRIDGVTGQITTVAGNGAEGFSGDGGLATSASLSSPGGIAVDAGGHLFIADTANDRIRRVDAVSGVISTIAGGGDGTSGTNEIGDGGHALQAILANPAALAFDVARENLYVADQYHGRIRRITIATGLIETVAGGGSAGFGGDGGPAVRARLNSPAGVAVGPRGDLYIADQNNARVRKVDVRTGLISTVAGGPPLRVLSPGSTSTGLSFNVAPVPFVGEGGAATAAPLLRPRGLALDAEGNLFIADETLSRVLKVDARTQVITNVAGIGSPSYTGEDEPAARSALAHPMGIAMGPAGDLLIADRDNNLVRRVSAEGVISRAAGSGNSTFAGEGMLPLDAALFFPGGVAFDPGGHLFIADAGNRRVRSVGADGALRTVAGGGRQPLLGCGREALPATSVDMTPIGIAFDRQGVLYIARYFDNAVCTVGLDGLLRPFAGDPFGFYSEFFGFNGDGELAVVAALANPYSVVVAASGDVFISDEYANRIRRVSARDGIITTFAGIGGDPAFSGDGGPAASAQLSAPRFLALDGDRFLYVSDSGNHRVRRIDLATRVITTVAGNGLVGYSGDGEDATRARLNGPDGLAIDADGNLFVADSGNHRIRKVLRTSGAIVTVAGNGQAGFSGDGGDALAAAFDTPTGLAFDAHGNLHVADLLNHRIRVLVPAAKERSP